MMPDADEENLPDLSHIKEPKLAALSMDEDVTMDEDVKMQDADEEHLPGPGVSEMEIDDPGQDVQRNGTGLNQIVLSGLTPEDESVLAALHIALQKNIECREGISSLGGLLETFSSKLSIDTAFPYLHLFLARTSLDPNLGHVHREHLALMAADRLNEIKNTRQLLAPRLGSTRLLASSRGSTANILKVVWDKGWLWKPYAEEPVFFPGPDNPGALDEIPAPLRRVVHQIRAQLISRDDKDRIMKVFYREIRPGAVLCTCGACNIRRYSNVSQDGRRNLPDPPSAQMLADRKYYADSVQELREVLTEMSLYHGERYHLMPLAELDILRLDESTLAYYESLPEIYQPALSTHLEDGVRYHLHSQFIQKDETGASATWICDRCHSDITNEKVPEISLAGGRDFGRPDRIKYVDRNGLTVMGLPDLTILEILVLSSVRAFAVLISLTTGAGKASLKALVGHCIFFPISAFIEAFKMLVPGDERKKRKKVRFVLPNLDGVPEILRVTFLGPAATFKERNLSPMTGFIHVVSVCANKISHWCRAIKALAPDPDAVELDETNMQARLDAVRQEILDQTHIGEHDDDKALYHAVESDVAAHPLSLDSDFLVMPGSGEDQGKILFGDGRYMVDRRDAAADSLKNIFAGLKKIIPNKATADKDDKHSDSDSDDEAMADTDSKTDKARVSKRNKQQSDSDDMNIVSSDDETQSGAHGGSKTDKSARKNKNGENDSPKDDSSKKIGDFIWDDRPASPDLPPNLPDDSAGSDTRDINVVTGNLPLCMFTECRSLYYGAFPTRFLLGRGLRGNGNPKGNDEQDALTKNKYDGPLKKVELDHLFYQSDNRFSNDPFFLWAAYDQQHISIILSQSAARVRHDPGSIKAILELVNADDFEELIKRCEDNPTSEEAKQFFALVTRHMVMAGSRAPFSAMQREQMKNFFIHMSKCFGPMSTFDTCSAVQDQTSLTYRLTQPSHDNLTFPATTHLHQNPAPGGVKGSESSSYLKLHDALLDGSAKKTMLVNHADGSTRTFNIHPIDLHEAASQNPIAAVTAYRLKQEAAAKHIFGATGFSYRKTTVPLSARTKGIHGVCTAAGDVLEVQARGWLHMHRAQRSGLTPNVMQYISECPALVGIAKPVLDSAYTAELPRYVHLETIKRKALGERSGYTSITMSPPYVSVSVKENLRKCAERAQVAALRVKILEQEASGALLWGMIPFLCTVSGIDHPDAAILETAFVADAKDPIVSPDDIDNHSWKQLADNMRASQGQEETAMLLALRSELLSDMMDLPSGLYASSLQLFHRVLSAVKARLQKYASLTLVYGYNKKFGFRCRVMHTAAGGNMHDHAPTCHTKPAGEFHCRMGIPNGLIVSTAPVQLLFNDKRQTPELQQDWKYIPGYDPTHPNRHRAVLKAPKLPSLQAPEFFGNPIADSDARIIYYENLRPKLDPLSEEELAQIKAELTAQKKSISQRSSQEQSEKNSRPSKHELNILKHVQEWEHRNGSLVCFNDVYMALMPGNQSINMLGSRVQSQIVTFYLTSYLSKDRVALAAILPVISSAYRRSKQYPSKASDAGSERRNTLYFIQKCTLGWAKQCEISAQQAAGAVSGLASDSYSEKGVHVHMGAAITHVAARVIKSGSSVDEYLDSKNQYVLYNSDYGPKHLDDGLGADMPALPDNSDPPPSVKIESANGKAILLLHHEMHAHRGPHLELMPFMMYPCIIQAVKIGKVKADDGLAVHGRPANLQFAFDDKYEHHGTHVQEIMSLQGFPMPIPFSPSHPLPMPQLLNAAWRKVASNWAEFYMTGFSHWNLDSGLPAFLSYDSCVQFLRYLTESSSIIDRTYLEVMRSMSASVTIDKETKRAHQSYHHRNSTVWSEEERAKYTKEVDEKTEANLSSAELAKLIQTLRDIAHLDEKGARRQEESAAYIEKMRNIMNELFDARDDKLPSPVVPQIFDKRSAAAKRAATRRYVQSISCDIPGSETKKIYQAMCSKEINDPLQQQRLSREAYQQRYERLKSDASKQPNSEQQAVIDKFIVYFEALETFNALKASATAQLPASNSRPPPTPPLIFIHAAGGVGKSFIASHLQHAADAFGFGHITTAVMGVACNQIGQGAVTIDSILRQRRPKTMKKKGTEDSTGYANAWLPKLGDGPLILKRMEEQMSTQLLIFDEISTSTPNQLALLNQHLQDMKQDSRPFGGMAVLLIADFFQLGALFGEGFVSVMIRNYITNAEGRTDTALPQHLGCELLRLFTYTVLHNQNRCKEQSRTACINWMRDPSNKPPINNKVIDTLKILTRQDILQSPGRRFAAFLSPGNLERCIWTWAQSQRFSLAAGKVIIRWKNPIQGATALSHPTLFDPLYRDPDTELWFVFIESAPGYTLYNYSVPRGVSNGPGCFMHSFSFGPDWSTEEKKAAEREIAAAKPGGVVSLIKPPYAVNIYKEISDDQAHLWSVDNTLERDLRPTTKKKWIVIPLLQGPYNVPYIVKKELTIHYKSIRVTLGFCKTFHKSQSLTEEMVTFDVNQRPPGILPLSLKGFFVAYTRVRSNADMRVLPPVNGDLRFSHLAKLTHDPILIHWLAGFKQGEVWDVQAARDHYNKFACAVSKKKSVPRSARNPIGTKPATGTKQSLTSSVSAALLRQTREAVSMKTRRHNSIQTFQKTGSVLQIFTFDPDPNDKPASKPPTSKPKNSNFNWENEIDGLKSQPLDQKQKGIQDAATLVAAAASAAAAAAAAAALASSAASKNKKKAAAASAAAAAEAALAAAGQTQMYPKTLRNLGNTCFASPPLQVFASIPEAVTAIRNLRFSNTDHSFQSIMGLRLQQLIPAISNRTIQKSQPINSALLPLYREFINQAAQHKDPNWVELAFCDAADIFRSIIETVPSIQELFSFKMQETQSCQCQSDDKLKNRVYIYESTPHVSIHSDGDAAQNLLIHTQNQRKDDQEYQLNRTETLRRQRNPAGQLCLRCMPGQQSANADYFLGDICPHHGPTTKKINWPKFAEYYPKPKCFPVHEIWQHLPDRDDDSTLSHHIITQLSDIENLEDKTKVCSFCGQTGKLQNRILICEAPPIYLMVTFVQSPGSPGTVPNPAHLPLVQYEHLNLGALFSGQHIPMALYTLHSAVIYNHRHYTVYLHDKTDSRKCMYIDDVNCMPTTPAIMKLVRENSRVLIYSRDPVIHPIPQPIVQQAAVNPIGIIPVPDAGPSVVAVPIMTVTSAFRDEVLRIENIIKTKTLRHALLDLFGEQNDNTEYWAAHIHPGRDELFRLFNRYICADQFRKMRNVPPALDGTKDFMLDSDMIDIVHGISLIAKGAKLDFDAMKLQHEVNTFDNTTKIRVFSCDFAKNIMTSSPSEHNLSRMKRWFHNDKILEDEELWCPAHMASNVKSTEGGQGNHFVIAHCSLGSYRIAASDSLSAGGGYSTTIKWLAKRMCGFFNYYLGSNTPWKTTPALATQVQQANNCDCALHLSSNLNALLFGIPDSVSSVCRLRQKLPVFVIAVCRVLCPAQNFNLQVGPHPATVQPIVDISVADLDPEVPPPPISRYIILFMPPH